ncbi:hypothetical protein CRUP_004805 [Coryphaenoides rupestris]|nr:hypothetical protein CRUP_004805 [Coryphaenoides rupestris]
MDTRAVFVALYGVCEENVTFFSGGAKGPQGDAARRLVDAMTLIQEHARSLEPVIHGFASGRYINTSRRSIFFRAAHNAGEMEAYCSALCQLRALLYLAQRLLHDNAHGNLFFQEESGLSQSFVREYASMHKGCFYGRCLGFQFTPAIRPFLQTIAIGLVAFGENYKRHQSGLGVAASSFFTSGKYAIDPELRGAEFERITQNLDVHFWKSFWNITETEVLSSLASMTSTTVKVNRALSVPPVPFDLPLVANPKASVTIAPPSAHIGPAPVQMRLISYDLREGQAKRHPPSTCLLIHFHGGGFVAQTSKSHELKTSYFKPHRLTVGGGIGGGGFRGGAGGLAIAHKLCEVGAAWCCSRLTGFCETRGNDEVTHQVTYEPISLEGGGQRPRGVLGVEVSRPYLKSWSQDLGVPILSVDYSLAPEAPFPRALEECFYAYCWAIKNHHLLGWTGESVCLAGDSAGGNLSVTTSMRAAAHGVRMPNGIVAAYPATLLTAYASPSRLLTLMDPLLPLSVLSRCLGAYAGSAEQTERPVEKVSTLGMVRRDTALLLRDFRQGASNWIHSLLDPSNGALPGTVVVLKSADSVRKSVSEASVASPHADPPVPPEPTEFSSRKQSLKSQTCQDLSSPHKSNSHNPPLLLGHTPEHVSFFLSAEVDPSVSLALSSVAMAPPGGLEADGSPREFPVGFEPLRSDQAANMAIQSSPVVLDPYCSPLLAPDSLLRGLPPVHLVACALDPMLDDSVMFAKRLRHAGQPVTLCVVDDLPHGFLTLSQLSRETREAADVCVARIRAVFAQDGGTAADVVAMATSPTTPQSEPRKHHKLERTHRGPVPPTDASATSSSSGGDGGSAAPSLSMGDDGVSVKGEGGEPATFSEVGAGTVAAVPSQNGAEAGGVGV